jgi:peptidoglycan/LPS O-acetylase OafA/YrhL
MAPRSLFIDGLKVLASQLIVLHHIVLYSPMAERLAPGWPGIAGFVRGEARYVVQVFLVIGGYLAAQGLARAQAPLPQLLWTRYLRLAPMLAVALLAVLAASAMLPPGRWPDWVTPWPTPGQFVAHLLLLQDVLGLPSLSAGAWYVAIDFQLHALLAVLVVLLPRAAGRPPWQGALPWAVAAMALLSLAWFSRDSALDMWAPYFFGAYGLGVLAAWAGRSRRLAGLFGLVCLLGLADAALASRPRVALACLTALALAVLAQRRSPAPGRGTRTLAYWSDASYGVFLIHYAVIVASTAVWLRLGLHGTASAWGLLLGCWAGSLAAGALLQRWVGAPLAHSGWAALRRVSER